MTSMISCIVGKKIGAVGSGHLELFPFVVLAICKCQNIETMLSLMAIAGVLVSICSLHGLVYVEIYCNYQIYIQIPLYIKF